MGRLPAANHCFYRTWRSSEGTADESIKKSLKHHPQGHNNTSSHAHDEVNTTLHMRRAAVLLRAYGCQARFSFCCPWQSRLTDSSAMKHGRMTWAIGPCKPPPPKKTAHWAGSLSVGPQTLSDIYESLEHCVHIRWQFLIRPHPSCCWLVFM